VQSNLINKADKWYMDTYSQFPLIITSGSGSIVFDDKERAYIDFTSGIGVSSVGYGNQGLTKAIKEQAENITHISNLYYNKPAAILAERLCSLTKMEKVFFANSGAEANEGAIKLARKYSFDKYGKNRNNIITLKQSFHGRTITTLAATGQDHFHKSFYPFTEGFKYVIANDIDDLRRQVDDSVCGIMLEAVQGEGGVYPLEKDFVKAVETIAKEKDIAIIFDEVQCGIGRTGAMLGYENFNIKPDIISLAKGLGGGVPIGAFLCNEKMSKVLGPGDHGSTYGGNPLVCAAANEVINQVSQEGFLESVKSKGEYIRNYITDWQNENIVSIRGMGLMIGIELRETIKVKDVQEKALEEGLLILSAGGNTIRLLPPLNISDNEINMGLIILKDILKDGVL